MAQNDWYPRRIADRVAWHANFKTQCAATGLADGLVAAQIAQVATDADNLAALVNYRNEIDTFDEGFSEFFEIMLDAPAGATVPPIPAPPAALTLVGNMWPTIAARTRQYAAILKAAPGYNAAKGEQYGIVRPAPAPLGVPSIAKATALVESDVSLTLAKAGYDVLLVESRRSGGDWEPIGVSQTRTFVDARDPIEAGKPEQREYRVRGMLNNLPSGDPSPVVSAVTLP